MIMASVTSARKRKSGTSRTNSQPSARVARMVSTRWVVWRMRTCRNPVNATDKAAT